MRMVNAAGTVVSVPERMVARMVARGWGQVDGGERREGRLAAPPSTSIGDDPAGTGRPPQGGPLDGVVTLAGATGDSEPPAATGLVPDGTAKDVVDWVGDDPQRARTALDAERAKGDDARSTLVAKLAKLAGEQ